MVRMVMCEEFLYVLEMMVMVGVVCEGGCVVRMMVCVRDDSDGWSGLQGCLCGGPGSES